MNIVGLYSNVTGTWDDANISSSHTIDFTIFRDLNGRTWWLVHYGIQDRYQFTGSANAA